MRSAERIKMNVFEMKCLSSFVGVSRMKKKKCLFKLKTFDIIMSTCIS